MFEIIPEDGEEEAAAPAGGEAKVEEAKVEEAVFEFGRPLGEGTEPTWTELAARIDQVEMCMADALASLANAVGEGQEQLRGQTEDLVADLQKLTKRVQGLSRGLQRWRVQQELQLQPEGAAHAHAPAAGPAAQDPQTNPRRREQLLRGLQGSGRSLLAATCWFGAAACVGLLASQGLSHHRRARKDEGNDGEGEPAAPVAAGAQEEEEVREPGYPDGGVPDAPETYFANAHHDQGPPRPRGGLGYPVHKLLGD